MQYKISPSILEEWRKTTIGAYGKTGQSFVDYICTPFETNEAASRGIAYHEMLENGPDAYRLPGGFEVKEQGLQKTWLFSDNAVEPIYRIRDQYPNMVFECWNDLELNIDGFDILIKMRLDGLWGLELHEFKTTGSYSIAAQKSDGTGYLQSLQHKVYLYSFPLLKKCKYHIFQLNKDNTDCKYHCFEYLRTGKEEAEVKHHIGNMMSWLSDKPEVLKKLEYKKH